MAILNEVYTKNIQWNIIYLVAHPTNRKWVITPVIYMG